MRRQGAARRLTTLVGGSGQYHHRSLVSAIVRRAHWSGRAGCSAFRGIEGVGASRTVHNAHLLSLSDDLPVAIAIVDDAERIEAFLPQLDELMSEGLVLLDDVHVVRYVGRTPEAP